MPEQWSGVGSALLRDFVDDFPVIHLIIGGVGNATFLVGSAFFLVPSLETAALWLFVVGSFGMLVGSLGEAFVRYRRKRRHD